MARLLVVEDESHLAEGLRFNLTAEGYQVDIVSDGESALERLLRNNAQYDVVILDVMLPGKDGFAVASTLRQAGAYVPLLMLTARGRAEDVLKGFEAGADDYLPKPFDVAILLARLRGLLRRREWLKSARAAASESGVPQHGLPSNGTDDLFRFDGKTIDFRALEVHAGPRVVHLTMMEAELLRHLVRNAGKVVSRKSILEDVWGLHQETDTRAIDNFIVRLRRYIEDVPSKPKHLITVRGVGYKFLAQ
jgi:DNA-binding response OmpR family regulator